MFFQVKHRHAAPAAAPSAVLSTWGASKAEAQGIYEEARKGRQDAMRLWKTSCALARQTVEAEDAALDEFSLGAGRDAELKRLRAVDGGAGGGLGKLWDIEPIDGRQVSLANADNSLHDFRSGLVFTLSTKSKFQVVANRQHRIDCDRLWAVDQHNQICFN